MKDLNKSKIYIAGHTGLVGSSCLRILKRENINNIITTSSSKVDLRNFENTYNFIKQNKPDLIICAAAKVGGIMSNKSYPYEFLMHNMQIQNNIIHSCFKLKIKKLIFLGSSCIYPKLCKQPIKEKYLLTSSLEDTNQWYALAKISGVKLIEALNQQYGFNYTCLMPTNLYGPNDNFDINNSHVVPALIRKFNTAKKNRIKKVKLWGNGKALREFLYVDDLARAILTVIKKDTNETIINVGSGQEISIFKLANLIKKIIKYEGIIEWDKNMPNGTPRKLLESSKINELGWEPKCNLNTGLTLTNEWYNKNLAN